MRINPSSKPRRNAAISFSRFAGSSAMHQVPCPRIGIPLPEGSGNVLTLVLVVVTIFRAEFEVRFGQEHALSECVYALSPPEPRDKSPQSGPLAALRSRRGRT